MKRFFSVFGPFLFVGVASSLHASTVPTEFRFGLTLESVEYYSVRKYTYDIDTADLISEEHLGTLDSSEFPWAPSHDWMPGMTIGDSTVMFGTYEKSPIPFQYPQDIIPECRIASFDCSTSIPNGYEDGRVSDSDIRINLDGGLGFEYVVFKGGTNVGDIITMDIFDYPGRYFMGTFGSNFYYEVNAYDIFLNFRVTESYVSTRDGIASAELVTNPLPAGIALLPAGLVGLVALRRRGRRGSALRT